MVKDTRYCLQQNLGLGGVSVVTIYQRADGKKAAPISDDEVGRYNGLGYNPATQAKGFNTEQAQRTVSQKSFSPWALQDTLTKVESRF
jgi:sterol carrier protein 2